MTTAATNSSVRLWLAILLLVSLWGTQIRVASAQQTGSYIVQPGDTLGVIATRFGVSVEQLAAANGITDVNLIEVGQTLLIPGPTQSERLVASRPGESLTDISRRWNVPLEQLAALNDLSVEQRLFPGQPVRLPLTADPPPLLFGAVQQIDLTTAIVQGETGWLRIESSRPLALSAAWDDGRAIPLTQIPTQGGVAYWSHLPVPALQPAGATAIVVSYTARNGRVLSRRIPLAVTAGDYFAQEIDLPPDRGALLASELVQEELALLQSIWTQTDRPIQWAGAFQRPIEEVHPTTSPFGTRRSYNGGPYSTYHSGQDFGAAEGITVTAPADGVVVLARPLTVRGNSVIIDHGVGVFTGYWHLSEILVEEDQSIRAGLPLGLVGNTGLSTGAHLHWELRIHGMAVNPMQFLNEALLPSFE